LKRDQATHRAHVLAGNEADDENASDDEEETEKKGKKKKGKGKKMAKARDSENDQGGGATVVMNSNDTLCNEAIIAVCRINVLEPPAPIHFGTWNDRPVNSNWAKGLASEMMHSFRPFATASMLPLIANKDDLEESCKVMDLNAEAAPMLTLTRRALDSAIVLKFAGGRHRVHATHVVRDELQDKIVKWNGQIMATKGKLAGEGNTEEQVLRWKKKLEMLETVLAAEEGALARIGIWGVLVYDAGKRSS
jgi:hypothetical protein